jgi:hypothetical protein
MIGEETEASLCTLAASATFVHSPVGYVVLADWAGVDFACATGKRPTSAAGAWPFSEELAVASGLRGDTDAG